jgi:hypothetical protein
VIEALTVKGVPKHPVFPVIATDRYKSKFELAY